MHKALPPLPVGWGCPNSLSASACRVDARPSGRVQPAGTAFAFALVGFSLDSFDLRLLGGLPSRTFGIMVNEVLVAVPLFVFMGVMLE